MKFISLGENGKPIKKYVYKEEPPLDDPEVCKIGDGALLCNQERLTFGGLACLNSGWFPGEKYLKCVMNFSDPGETWKGMSLEEFEKLQPVRLSSSCGPCLTSYRFVKKNAKTIRVAHKNGYFNIAFCLEPIWRVHYEPCPGCMDSEHTIYPNGYQD